MRDAYSFRNNTIHVKHRKLIPDTLERQQQTLTHMIGEQDGIDLLQKSNHAIY